MKKVFVVLLALCGIVMLIKGILNFFPLNLSSLDNNIAYNLGHNFGVVFRKTAKIIISIFMIKQCYYWFGDESKTQKA